MDDTSWTEPVSHAANRAASSGVSLYMFVVWWFAGLSVKNMSKVIHATSFDWEHRLAYVQLYSAERDASSARSESRCIKYINGKEFRLNNEWRSIDSKMVTSIGMSRSRLGELA